ncbi:hypothetical protein FKM82_019040 [Ascaphus truei]
MPEIFDNLPTHLKAEKQGLALRKKPASLNLNCSSPALLTDHTEQAASPPSLPLSLTAPSSFRSCCVPTGNFVAWNKVMFLTTSIACATLR